MADLDLVVEEVTRQDILTAGDVVNFSNRQSPTNGLLVLLQNKGVFLTNNSTDIEAVLVFLSNYIQDLHQNIVNLATIVSALPSGAGASTVVAQINALTVAKKVELDKITLELK